MRTASLNALIMTLVLALGSCSPAGQIDLEGTAWELTYINGNPLIEGTSITLFFEGEGIRGGSGCNTYFGGFTLAPAGGIQLSDIGMTEMACLEPEGLMAQESTYLGLLGDVERAVLQGDQLTLQDASGQDVLVFTAASG